MPDFNFTPFPGIETERLILRKLELSDAEQMYLLRSDKGVNQYTSIPVCPDVATATAYIERITGLVDRNESIMWGIALKDAPKLIGTICLWNLQPENFRAEIGYVMLTEYHGKGIMSEAMKEVLTYGFGTMNLHTIEAHVAPENSASIKILERNGFVKEAHFKENFFKDGVFLDTAVYTAFNSK